MIFYSRHDVVHLFEDGAFPKGLHLTDAICRISVLIELGVNFADLLKLTSQYFGYQTKLFGPQEDELQENAEPILFAAQMKMRREAAQTASESAIEMESKELKGLLQERGYRDKGTQGELADRVARVLRRQAEQLGFGEMSAFGERVARSIFSRVDEDNDKALSFSEAAKLQRRLHSLPQSDEGEYIHSVAELELASNRKGYLKEDGLVAYYDIYGRLADDAAVFGIGSFDDFLNGTLAVTGELDGGHLNKMEQVSL